MARKGYVIQVYPLGSGGSYRSDGVAWLFDISTCGLSLMVAGLFNDEWKSASYNIFIFSSCNA